MATKKLKKKVQTKSPAGKLGDQVVDSAREIWLAGLGAFAVAQQESGKMIEQSNKLFERLVKEGKKIEKDTRGAADRTVDDFRDEVESRVDSVRQQASDNWDKLENIFEDRVARVLGRMGVPTADDVNKLSARVQRLTDQVAELSEKGAPAPAKKATRKKTTRKTTARKAASKKAASKKAAPEKAAS
ncbi:MAG: phasin family protein [Gammaproteobacteria bacterium]